MTASTFTLRDRAIPMIQVLADQYRYRVPAGYPVLVDNPAHQSVGIELDPSYSLHLIEENGRFFAELYYRSTRFDARSSASREKFGGSPTTDRRDLGTELSDQAIRNLLAELVSRFNFQQSIIHLTDT